MDAEEDGREEANSAPSKPGPGSERTQERATGESGSGGAEWHGDAAPADSGKAFARTVDRQLNEEAASPAQKGGTAVQSDEAGNGSAGIEADRQQEPALEEDEASIVKPDNS
ncbi:hypothetical protein IV498_01640 [Paenarthrobacter sp. Z7-10]|nr:hypothetical protein [Paenarthrobacter sp. Z7-10]